MIFLFQDVCMDRLKPTHVVSYDEVQSNEDPSNPNIVYTTLQTYLVNYQVEKAVVGDGLGMVTEVDANAVGSSSTRVRRLSGWDDAEYHFHQHIRNTNKALWLSPYVCF